MWSSHLMSQLRQSKIEALNFNIDILLRMITNHEMLATTLYTPARMAMWRYMNNNKMLRFCRDNVGHLEILKIRLEKAQDKLIKLLGT